MDFGAAIILGNALILGIRHGVDWDHIAAIADIVSTATSIEIDGGAIALFRQKSALRLSSCYAFGHATIVLILGVAALMFATVLPAWIDPLMQRAVGFTLLGLSAWIFYSILRRPLGDEGFVLQSRWMFILDKLRHAGDWVCSLARGEKPRLAPRVSQYDNSAAFGLGVLHGFGAETGTQVLLIAAVGGSSSNILGALILLSFISGLLISNTLVAIMACAGFVGSVRFKPVLVAISVLTGLFSLIVGALFASGCGSVLPAISR